MSSTILTRRSSLYIKPNGGIAYYDEGNKCLEFVRWVCFCNIEERYDYGVILELRAPFMTKDRVFIHFWTIVIYEPVHTGAIQTYDHQFFSSSEDGGWTSKWRTHRIFRIQEGAIVKFICPTASQVGLNANVNNKHVDMFLDLGGLEIAKKGEPNGVKPDGIRVKERFQMYQNTGLGFNGRRGKRLLTMTYTARKEDNLKTLSCRLSDEDLLDSVQTGSSYDRYARDSQSMIRLLILPGPTALRYQYLVTDHTWPGGFVGKIHIPIDSFYNSWKMVLKFPKPVFRLYAGNFNIAREPCLHEGSCTKSRNTWVIYNTYENRVLSPLKDLHLTFIADVSKKMKKARALVADIKFYGYKVFGSDARPIWEPWE